jgi:tRNA-2-methylthio-N6-dimethylallyladenosine synthase
MGSGKYWLETYGCQMNKAESNALELELKGAGWAAAADPGEADLVILNTCSVRITAEDRIWGRLGQLVGLKEKRPFTLTVMGCMAENYSEDLTERVPGVDLVVGTFRKASFVKSLDRLFGEDGAAARLAEADSKEKNRLRDELLPEDRLYRFQDIHAEEGGFKAFVPIMHGCNNFCSYCIVPYVRGREISREPDEILAELDRLESQGVKEVTLLGQNVNSFRFAGEDGRTVLFPGLLGMIAGRVRSIEWIRFLTSHPKDLSDELIDLIAANRKLCRHIHLPVQHGSNAILRAMNRRYTAEGYRALVERIRRTVPDVSLTTDLIIGFPGETEQDLDATLGLMQDVGFDDAFTYKYNPREGTKAYELGDTVPDEVKLERLSRVIELQRRIGHTRKEARLGSREKVLVEGVSKKNAGELLARTERDEMVVFPGPVSLIGGFRTVELSALSGNTFKAKEIT